MFRSKRPLVHKYVGHTWSVQSLASGDPHPPHTSIENQPHTVYTLLDMRRAPNWLVCTSALSVKPRLDVYQFFKVILYLLCAPFRYRIELSGSGARHGASNSLCDRSHACCRLSAEIIAFEKLAASREIVSFSKKKKKIVLLLYNYSTDYAMNEIPPFSSFFSLRGYGF